MKSQGIIHRDIKSENILMGDGRRGNQIYISDMGTAAEYSSVDSGARPKKPQLIGTPDFACLGGHLGVGKSCDAPNVKWRIVNYVKGQSCRDDMESLGYLMLYLVCGSLPWQRVKTTIEEERGAYPRDERDN